MAAGDITAWRRQNSDVVPLALVLADGSDIRGTMLVPRDKGLRDTLMQPEPFIEIETETGEQLLVAKSQLRHVRRIELPKADQLDQRLRTLERLEVYKVLRIERGAAIATAEASAAELKALYDPVRAADLGLPAEVVDYIAVMHRRIETALTEFIRVSHAEAEAQRRNLKAPALRKPAA